MGERRDRGPGRLGERLGSERMGEKGETGADVGNRGTGRKGCLGVGREGELLPPLVGSLEGGWKAGELS